MTNLNNTLTGRKGVNAVATAFTDIGWLFRETTHTDFGIDGDVEQVIEGMPTGHHIALQIKSGTSYLKENKNRRITFYIDEWHYKYWLQYDRPVIILFYDEQSNTVIWEQVKLSNISSTKRQFKVEINPNKVLNDSSIDELLNIIETYQPHNFHLFDNICLSHEYVKYCIDEMSRATKMSIEENEHFNQVILQNFEYQNEAIFDSAISQFAKSLQFYNAVIYDYSNKVSWILVKWAWGIPNTVFDHHIKTVTSEISFIDEYSSMFDSVNEIINLLKLRFPNMANLQQSCSRCVTTINDGISALNLVKETFKQSVHNVNLRMKLHNTHKK